MILYPPLAISPRLLPALQVDDAWISLDCTGSVNGRPEFYIYFDLPDGEHRETGLQGGPRIDPDDGGDLREVFGSVLSFLTAAAESYMGHGENYDLFSEPVVEWAYQHSDELSMLAIELSGEEDQ